MHKKMWIIAIVVCVCFAAVWLYFQYPHEKIHPVSSFPYLAAGIAAPPSTEILAENSIVCQYHGGSDNHSDWIYYWIAESKLDKEDLTQYYANVLRHTQEDLPGYTIALEIHQGTSIQTDDSGKYLDLPGGALAADITKAIALRSNRENVWAVIITMCDPKTGT